jgi:hypothetical protein
MDNQQREILGRLRLTEALIRAGLDVAHPVRDRGVDLIAYVDGDSNYGNFQAIPIQMKAATKEGFSIDRGYEKMRGLLLVYAWYVGAPEKTVFYAMSYAQALNIADIKGWTKTKSWISGNYYTSTSPDKKLKSYLEPFRMTDEKWAALFITPKIS